MANVYRVNRKSSDNEIIRLNAVGLSLGTIARVLGCHPTTVTIRLKQLQIEPADTRRTFMEDIFTTFEDAHQEWLADHLTANGKSIKQFVKELMVEDFKERTNATKQSTGTNGNP